MERTFSYFCFSSDLNWVAFWSSTSEYLFLRWMTIILSALSSWWYSRLASCLARYWTEEKSFCMSWRSDWLDSRTRDALDSDWSRSSSNWVCF